MIDPTRAVQPRARIAVVGRRLAAMVAGLAARLASWRVWIVSATAFGVLSGLFFASSAPFSTSEVTAACGQEPPDARFGPSGGEVSSFLDACGVAGRSAYRSMQVVDLVYPLVVGMFLATSLALVLARLAPGRRSVAALAVLPLVGTGFDYLENSVAWLALAAFPATSAGVWLFGVASVAKTLAFWTAGVLLLGCLGALVVAEARRRVRGRVHGTAAVVAHKER